MKKYGYSFLMVLISCAIMFIGGQEVSAVEITQGTGGTIKDNYLYELLYESTNPVIPKAPYEEGQNQLTTELCQTITSVDFSSLSSINTEGIDVCLNVSQVTSIDLSNINITEDAGILAITKTANFLTNINLSYTGLTGDLVIPNNWNKLTTLNLKGNYLDTVTFAGAMTSLYNLNVSYNQLTSITFNGTTALSILDLSSNSITSVNTGINGPNHIKATLTELNLANNQLTAVNLLPIIINNLENLNLSNNQISTLTLGVMPELKNLNLRSNLLTSISFGSIPKLTNLNLANNLLVTVTFTEATLIETLDLSTNAMTNIDTGIVGKEFLTALKTINLTSNQLTDFTGIETFDNTLSNVTLSVMNNPTLGGIGTLSNWNALKLSKVTTLHIENHGIDWSLESNLNAYNELLALGMIITGANIPTVEPVPTVVDSEPVAVVTPVVYIEYGTYVEPIETVIEEEEIIPIEAEKKEITKTKDTKEESNTAFVTITSVAVIIILILLGLAIAKKVKENRREIIVVKKIEPKEEKTQKIKINKDKKPNINKPDNKKPNIKLNNNKKK